MSARTEFVETIGANTRTVPVEQVIVLRSDSKYVMAVHPGGELILRDVLKDLEQEFGERFVRTHRSCLVERSRLGALVRDQEGRYSQVWVNGLPEPVPLSRRYASAIRKLAAGNE